MAVLFIMDVSVSCIDTLVIKSVADVAVSLTALRTTFLFRKPVEAFIHR